MKKICNCMVILIMLSSIFMKPNIVIGKTLGDVKDELKQKQEEYNKNKEQQALTQSEINKTNASIDSLKKSIEQAYVDIANLETDVDRLNQTIVTKNEEIKAIINYIQVASGESSYMEYAFGARDFTDFIYRMAVAEQMTEYNEKLIDDYNKAIIESRNKQEEMRKRQSEMAEQQKELEEKTKSLGKELEEQGAVGLKVEDEIEYQKEIIELYESKGCKDNESIDTCGRDVLPKGTAFYRPTEYGGISSEWGTRYLVGDWHEGIDIAVSQGTPVYAIGTGMVASTIHRSSTGGNMIVIHHNINGQTYTSVYAHLNSINVSKGQNVDRNTVIGYSGGGANTMAPSNICGLPNGTGWDRYTCGEHLHLTVATGLYGKDYFNWSYELNRKYSINPRNVINFPGRGVRWSDRLTAY